MKNKIYKIIILAFCAFLTSCSKIDNSDVINQDDLAWLDNTETTLASDSTNNTEEIILSPGISGNVLSSNNMPIASDTFIYKGNKMSYGFAIKNSCDYTADATFFIIIDGYLQPFIPEDSSLEVNSVVYRLDPGEEKIIHYSFTPISAPYGKNSVISFVGLLTNIHPVTDKINLLLNTTTASCNRYITAENDTCQIKLEDNKNILGDYVEKMSLAGDNQSSIMILADSKKNKANYSFPQQNDLKLSNDICIYAARISNAKLRAFLWCEGEFLDVFNGVNYADIPYDKYALYEIPVEKSLLKGESTHYDVLYLDMDVYKQILDGTRNLNYSIIDDFQLYTIS